MSPPRKFLGIVGSCRSIGFRRLIGIIKTPKMNIPSVNKNRSAPISVSFMPRDALEPRRVVFEEPTIVMILRACRFAQITISIIHRIAVSVVNLIFRPFSRNIKPRKTVGRIQNIIHPNHAITLAVAPGGLSDDHFFACFFLPSENARPWTIIQDFAQALIGDKGSLSHPVNPPWPMIRGPSAVGSGLDLRFIAGG